jgi:hypothetical protein
MKPSQHLSQTILCKIHNPKKKINSTRTHMILEEQIEDGALMIQDKIHL